MGEVEGGLEVCTQVVENDAKCCRSASSIKGSKKGAGRGVMISVLVGWERRERREKNDDPLDEETTDCVVRLVAVITCGTWGSS